MPSSGPGWASLISPIDCGPQHPLRAQSPDAVDDTSGCSELDPVGWVGWLASARPAEGRKQPVECSQRKAAFPWRGLTAQCPTPDETMRRPSGHRRRKPQPNGEAPGILAIVIL